MKRNRVSADNLTCPALKADKSSLKSWCIRGLSFHRIKVKVEVHYSANSLASRLALPGPIFVRLHRFQAAVPSNPLVHRIKLAQSTKGHTSTIWHSPGYLGVNVRDSLR